MERIESWDYMRKKYLLLILVLQVFLMGFTKPDYQFIDYTDSDYEYSYTRDWYTDIITQPVSGKISSFDVNNDGMLAMVVSLKDEESAFDYKDYLLLYNEEGEFIKGFSLNSASGSDIYVSFISNNIGINYSKGSKLKIMDINGNKITIKKLQNTYDIFKYLSSKNPKEMNGYKYYTDKPTGFFPINLFTNPTRMIIEDPEGNKKIISDGYDKENFYTIVAVSFIIFFSISAMASLILGLNEKFKNERK